MQYNVDDERRAAHLRFSADVGWLVLGRVRLSVIRSNSRTIVISDVGILGLTG